MSLSPRPISKKCDDIDPGRQLTSYVCTYTYDWEGDFQTCKVWREKVNNFWEWMDMQFIGSRK